MGEDTKPESIWVGASRVLADAKVSLRVVELQEAARLRNEVTVDSLTKELEDARGKAMKDDKGASAAVSATMGKAKLHGLVTDKQELAGKNGGPIETESKLTLDPSKLSSEVMAEILNAADNRG